MEYKDIAAAVKLCGDSPKIDQCKKCHYWAGGDMRKCILKMTDDAATAITDLLGRAKAAEAENKRWSQVCEAQERHITELEARAKKADEKLEAAVFDLLKAEKAAEETNALLDDEVHPVCDYSLYLAIHDSVSDIVNWQREGVWRNQKEESL